MTTWTEWDYDNPAHRQRRRSRPEVEIMEPDEPRRAHVEITIRHRRPNIRRLVIIAALVMLALILVRSPLALLMLAVLVGPQIIATGLFVALVLAIVAWREHRAGRPF